MAGFGNTYNKALEDGCSVNASPMNETKAQKTSPPAVACTSMSSNQFHILMLIAYK